jgi:hypothetical protein
VVIVADDVIDDFRDEKRPTRAWTAKLYGVPQPMVARRSRFAPHGWGPTRISLDDRNGTKEPKCAEGGDRSYVCTPMIREWCRDDVRTEPGPTESIVPSKPSGRLNEQSTLTAWIGLLSGPAGLATKLPQ